MHTIIYSSLAKRPMSDDDIRCILDTARTHNPTVDITGMLLYKNEEFLQVLEGERTHVQSLIDRISEDPRHERVTILVDRPIEHRDFPDWSMGFSHVSDEDLKEDPAFNPFLEHGFVRHKPSMFGAARDLLLHFRRKNADRRVA